MFLRGVTGGLLRVWRITPMNSRRIGTRQMFSRPGGDSSATAQRRIFGGGSRRRKFVVSAMEEPSVGKRFLSLGLLGATCVIWYKVVSEMASDGILTEFLLDNNGGIQPQPVDSSLTFADIGGCDEAVQDMQVVMEFLKDPKKFERMGAKLPKGILLSGPPGTGKTLLAKATANESSVAFFYQEASAFDEMFVGLGARRVRQLFAAARAKAPCMIFIDEIDAIGGQRQASHNHTLNQLLTEMDGFTNNDGIIVVGATNSPHILDKALTRPGRFDKKIHLDLPDTRGRLQILTALLKRVPLDNTVDVTTVAKMTQGMSGAKLAQLVNEAAIRAAEDGTKLVLQSHLEYAYDKITLGRPTSKSANVDIKQMDARKVTAYHEAGHALVSMALDAHALPVHKATIQAHRGIGGFVHSMNTDNVFWTKQRLQAQMAVALGGRIAEEAIFGYDDITTGASSDLKTATEMARHMIITSAMNSDIGFNTVNLSEASQHTKGLADEAVARYVSEAQETARRIIGTNREKLERIAQMLLEKDTLNRDELYSAFNGSTA